MTCLCRYRGRADL